MHYLLTYDIRFFAFFPFLNFSQYPKYCLRSIVLDANSAATWTYRRIEWNNISINGPPMSSGKVEGMLSLWGGIWPCFLVLLWSAFTVLQEKLWKCGWINRGEGGGQRICWLPSKVFWGEGLACPDPPPPPPPPPPPCSYAYDIYET